MEVIHALKTGKINIMTLCLKLQRLLKFTLSSETIHTLTTLLAKNLWQVLLLQCALRSL